MTPIAWEVQGARHECRMPGVVDVSFRPHAVGPAGWAVTVCEHHGVPVPEAVVGQGWGVGVNALRLAGKSDTDWDIIEGRSDRLVGRVVWENGAFFLIDVDGDVELGAFHRLEHTVPAAEALLVGPLYEPPSAA